MATHARAGRLDEVRWAVSWRQAVAGAWRWAVSWQWAVAADGHWAIEGICHGLEIHCNGSQGPPRAML
jgi:hypothetical protein